VPGTLHRGLPTTGGIKLPGQRERGQGSQGTSSGEAGGAGTETPEQGIPAKQPSEETPS
jgi:hypothetical protein